MEGRVGHYEHVARAEFHVCEHDADEAGWEGESADEGRESGIAGSEAWSSAGQDEVEACAEGDEDSGYEGLDD